jgi:hypothetical protein
MLIAKKPHKNLNFARINHLTYAAANVTKKEISRTGSYKSEISSEKHPSGVEKYRIAK